MNEGKKKKRVSVREVLNGRFLESEWLKRNRVLLIFIFIMLIINISVRYKSEKIIREVANLEEELKELRSESITVAADLMKISKQSEIIDRVKKSGLGLTPSKEPPRKLFVDKE
jgi:cell division protein FtsL